MVKYDHILSICPQYKLFRRKTTSGLLKMRLSKAIGVATLSIAVSGCSFFGGDKELPDIPETELYEQALDSLETANYELAVERLQLLEARYPFGRYSEQAQLELIFAYYKNNESTSARSAADRFIRLHPNHQNIDYAYYLKGLTAFEQDRSFFSKYLPIDENTRDPGAALSSFESFSTLLERYPNSPYAPDARKRMIHLKNRLAFHEVHVAHYYLQRGAFVAAANRGRYVVENLQETPAIPDALAIMIESYDALEMHELAASARDVLSSNYPDYKYRPVGEENKSLWDTATFNLFSDNSNESRPPVTTPAAKDDSDDESIFSKITFGVFDDDKEEKQEKSK